MVDNPALADRQRDADLGHFRSDTIAARITDRTGTIVDGCRGGDHVNEFGFIRRRHDNKTRKAAEIGYIEGTGMGRTIGADQTSAINRKTYRQRLQRDVVHHLIIGALQERGVNRAEWLKTLGRHSGRKRYRVLLSNADVERSFRIGFFENVDSGARWHRCGDGDDSIILRRFLDQTVAKYFRIRRRIRFALRLLAGGDIKLHNPMIFVTGGLSWRVAFALFRNNVNQYRSLFCIAHIPEHRQKVVEVMAVDRTDIVEAQFLKHRAPSPKAACELLCTLGLLLEKLRQVIGKLLSDVAEFQISLPGQQ